ncbi:protein UPSTREAM OF FLC [Melia azedarach]|uniref:Protein UPSTREAM OF FLC n=1 Tax=Melia azedarach TaxID=155640 RepID=A0ACC1YTC4_MELAZ|nr:protein UPSTREAM OF FLC [Melia azedarach]
MEVSSRGLSRTTTDLQVSRRWKGRDQQTSPERTKVWTEPNKNKPTGNSSERKVPVVYYLSRNGQLEHPHFMDVPLSSPEGLYLRDVINRLNLLRGKGMASMYSWSSKRSYKNGFVWHDLTENDFIYPAHGQEYVLKGSEIIDPSSLSAKPLETALSSSFRVPKSGDESSEFPMITRRRNQSWSSIDLNEYKVYKTEPNSESFQRLAADASTQTDDKRRRRRPVKVEEEDEEKNHCQESYENPSTELSREEISPPPSDSSPETLESLMKADGRLILCSGSSNDDISHRTADNYPSGRMKASTVLMQLISCGSISFKDCGPAHVKDQGFSLIGHYKTRLPRGAGDKKETVAEREISNFSRVTLEDKEYFSGSLIETNKKEEVPPALKRSSSYNADRSSQLQLAEKEIDGVRAKCIPKRPKALPTKKESNRDSRGESGGSSQNGNKSLDV